MADITIVQERSMGRIGTFATVIPHTKFALSIVTALIECEPGHITIHCDAAEEVAALFRKEGLEVEIK